MSEGERRYTRAEFSQIMERAAHSAGTSAKVTPPEESLSLDEIKAIAYEVGMDPNAVVRAAHSLPHEFTPSITRRVLGGSLRIQRDMTVSGDLTDDRAKRLLWSVRRAVEVDGKGGGDGSGVSWSSERGGRVFVSAYGDGQKTRVEIAVNTRPMVPVYLYFGSIGLVATVYAAIAAGDAGVVNPYYVLAGGAGTTAGLVWAALRRTAGKTKKMAEALVNGIAKVLEEESAS